MASKTYQWQYDQRIDGQNYKKHELVELDPADLETVALLDRGAIALYDPTTSPPPPGQTPKTADYTGFLDGILAASELGGIRTLTETDSVVAARYSAVSSLLGFLEQNPTPARETALQDRLQELIAALPEANQPTITAALETLRDAHGLTFVL